MARVRYNVIHQVGQSIASTRPVAWFYARTLHHCDRLVGALTGGRFTLSGILAGLPVVMVQAIGAKSGKTYQTPLLGISEENNPETFAVIGTNYGQRHHPAWVFNLRAHPRVQCTVRGKTGTYLAHEAKGEEYERFWERATEIYVGYPLYKQRIDSRRIHIMVLVPVGD